MSCWHLHKLLWQLPILG